jgi:hypothetical protein
MVGHEQSDRLIIHIRGQQAIQKSRFSVNSRRISGGMVDRRKHLPTAFQIELLGRFARQARLPARLPARRKSFQQQFHIPLFPIILYVGVHTQAVVWVLWPE